MAKLNTMGRLWDRIGSAFERSDIGAEEDASLDAEGVRPTATRYAPIRQAIERRITAFLRQDMVSHLEIGANEMFALHYIEIAADAQGEEELTHFLHEFTPEARVQWIRKLLGPALGRHVSVRHFLGLDREFSAEQLAETDPFEEQLNLAATPPYAVILHGRWELATVAEAEAAAEPAAPLEPAQPSATARVAGPCLRLSVQDGKLPAGELRPVEVDQFPAVLGSSAHADIEVSGYYVSARHCSLHWEAGQVWVADHSTNGTWVDGKRIHRGARAALSNGAVVGFGRDRGEGEYERYPAIEARFVGKPVAVGSLATPVAPSRATPVAPALAAVAAQGTEGRPLAVLSVFDATGSPRRDVLRLPFTIGRGSAQDYVVPDANQGVSREHLVIERIDADGAAVRNLAVDRNGSFAGARALPERFGWAFGEEIALGEKWTDAPAVRITLRKVEPAA